MVVLSGLEEEGELKKGYFAWAEELVEGCKARLAYFSLQEDVGDGWKWDTNLSGVYSAKWAYGLISKFDLISVSLVYKI